VVRNFVLQLLTFGGVVVTVTANSRCTKSGLLYGLFQISIIDVEHGDHHFLVA